MVQSVQLVLGVFLGQGAALLSTLSKDNSKTSQWFNLGGDDLENCLKWPNCPNCSIHFGITADGVGGVRESGSENNLNTTIEQQHKYPGR
eukprot:2637592-Amphidinium_carterae.1